MFKLLAGASRRAVHSGSDGVSVDMRKSSAPIPASGADSPATSTQSTPAMSPAQLESPAARTRLRFISSLDEKPTDDALAQGASIVIYDSLIACLKETPATACDAFDERLRAGRNSKAMIPTVISVHQFFRQACRRAGFQVAVVVSVTVIFDRIVKIIPPHSRNWRILLLLSILLAQKVIDDVALGTNQMPELFRSATKGSMSTFTLATRDVIRMELDLLSACRYDVAISSDAWDVAYAKVKTSVW